MSSKENEDAFVISRVMKGGLEVPGREANLRGCGVEWDFFNWVVKGRENEGQRKGICGF